MSILLLCVCVEESEYFPSSQSKKKKSQRIGALRVHLFALEMGHERETTTEL